MLLTEGVAELDGLQGPYYVHEVRNSAQVRVGKEVLVDHTDVCGHGIHHLPPGKVRQQLVVPGSLDLLTNNRKASLSGIIFLK